MRRGHKYRVAHADDRTWRGKVYASKAERLYAEFIRRLPSTAHVIEQPRLWLGVVENVYVPDFFVVRIDGSFEYVDVKGVETAAFRKNEKLWNRYGPCDLRIVKRRADKFVTDRIIAGGAHGCAPTP